MHSPGYVVFCIAMCYEPCRGLEHTILHWRRGWMAKFGHLQEFNVDLEPITAYLECVSSAGSSLPTVSVRIDKRLTKSFFGPMPAEGS